MCKGASCPRDDKNTINTFLAEVLRTGSSTDLAWTQVSQSVGWYAFSTSLIGFVTRKLLLWVVPPYCGEFARWAVLNTDWRLIRWVLSIMGVSHGDASLATTVGVKERLMAGVRMLGSIFVQRPAAGRAFVQGYKFGEEVVQNKGVLIFTPVVMREVVMSLLQRIFRSCRAFATAVGLVASDINAPMIEHETTAESAPLGVVAISAQADDEKARPNAPNMKPTKKSVLFAVPLSLAALGFRWYHGLP